MAAMTESAAPPIPSPTTPPAGRWLTAGTPITIAPGAGQAPVTISWEVQDGHRSTARRAERKNKNPCKGTFAGTAHRSYGAINATNGSGPIQTMQILQRRRHRRNQSYAQGTSQTGIVVQIGIQDVLELAKASDPPVQLRVVVGSQNQSVDCDPGISNLEGELRGGMRAHLRPKRRLAVVPNSPSALWGTAQPWFCVATQTGGATNQIPKGLNERILGAAKPSSCTSPNHWPNYQPGDPRVVQIFVTPFGSFDGQGKHDRAGDALRGLLHHRLDGAGAASTTPARGTATTRRPTRQPSSATSSSTSTPPATAPAVARAIPTPWTHASS